MPSRSMPAIQSLWQHMRLLWPRWTLLPPAPLVLWCAYALFVKGEVTRWELWALIVIPPALAYTNAATKKLFIGLYPLGLVGMFYDAMRFVKYVGITAGDVHDCDLHAMDARFFGLTTATGERIAWPDYFYTHDYLPLDLFCAFFYGTFIFLAIAYATYLYVKDFPAMRRFTWTFLTFNLAGFVTYHIYPAAPPWYFHAHGCMVDLASHASEGAKLARVDATVGIAFFHGLYGRSNDVFGAVPSLHVAYPLLVTIEAWRHSNRAMRALASGFFACMCFSAVYLDHHWVFDVLLGITYTFVGYAFVSWRLRAQAAPEETPATALVAQHGKPS